VPTGPLTPSPEKVATPPLVCAVVDPITDAPPPVTVADTVTAWLTRLDWASRTSITGCVVRAAPLVAPAGCVRIVICAGAPGASAIAPDVTLVRPDDANMSV
jgi:hypothetical protein